MTARTPSRKHYDPAPRNIAREIPVLVALGLLAAIAVVWLVFTQAFQALEVLT